MGTFSASPAVCRQYKIPASRSRRASTDVVQFTLTTPTLHDPCCPHGIGSGLEYRLHSGVANQRSERNIAE